MKFFSRKALVASATAIAVTFGGASVATAAETPTPSAAAPTTSTPKSDNGSSSDLNAKDIRDWIAVFTAVIGALGTLLTFMGKYFKLPF